MHIYEKMAWSVFMKIQIKNELNYQMHVNNYTYFVTHWNETQ